MTGVAWLQFIAVQGAGAQADAAEAAFGPLEFGGTMYKFAIPIISLAFLMMLGEQFLSLRAAGKAALQATGSAADKAATRIGDAATGGATQGTMDAASRQMASAMVGSDVADQKQGARDLHAKRGAIEKQRRGDG